MFGNKKKTQTAQRGVADQKLGADLDFASAEAYNLLRTNVSFALPGKQGCKIIGITSACPQEGKSFTSINFAYALAKNGSRVLLLDGDMRRPSIAASLDLSRVPGLSNVLTRQNEVEEVLHKNILNENLTVLLSGNIPPNPSELLGSEEMKALLDRMSADYDYIIVDLPPVISVSDALVISKYLDGIVLVLRHGFTRRRNVQEAIRQLRFVEARILGFVYNGYRSGSSYYRTSRRYYRYGKYYRYYEYSSRGKHEGDHVRKPKKAAAEKQPKSKKHEGKE